MSMLPSDKRFFVYPDRVDGRKGFNGLCGLVRDELGENPAEGDVFIFVNYTRKRIKLLFWKDNGFVLYYKMLEKGIFQLPPGRADGQAYSISEAQLLQLLRGVCFQKEKLPVHRKKKALALEGEEGLAPTD